MADQITASKVAEQLIVKYGSLDKVPENELRRAGFSDRNALLTAAKRAGHFVPSSNQLKPPLVNDRQAGNLALSLLGNTFQPKDIFGGVALNPRPVPPPNVTPESERGGGGTFGPPPPQLSASAAKAHDDFNGLIRHAPPPQLSASDAMAHDDFNGLIRHPQEQDVSGRVGSKFSDFISNEGAPVNQVLPPQYSYKVNNFDDQANAMAAQAYAPQYAALDSAKVQVDKNYKIADHIVGGLYKQLGVDVKESGAQQAQQYSDAGQAAGQRAESTQQNIADTYSNSQQQQADIMKSLGIESAAPATLAQGTTDSAFNQSQAAQSGTDQQNYYAKQGQAANDYTTGIGNAVNTAGVVAQQGLLQGAQDQKSAYDQQGLNLKGQQALQALGLGQNLSNQDLQLQQLNYGAGQDYYHNQQGAEAAASQQQSAQQDALFKMQQILYSQDQDKLKQDNFNKTYGLDQAKVFEGQREYNQDRQDRLDAPAAEDKPIDPKSDPLNAFNQTISSYFPSTDPDKLTKISNLSKYIQNLVNTGAVPVDPREFAQFAAAQADAYGIDPQLASNAAMAWAGNPILSQTYFKHSQK